jgi:hypothetical protein
MRLAACQEELKGKTNAIKANRSEFQATITDILNRKMNGITGSDKIMGSNL